MFPGPTELLLIGCLIELTWTPKIQIKYVDTKNQLADFLTKGNFTRDEWNHHLCLFKSALNAALKPSRRGYKKVIAKRGLPPNRDQ